jgi:hypothetical protein
MYVGKEEVLLSKTKSWSYDEVEKKPLTLLKKAQRD